MQTHSAAVCRGRYASSLVREWHAWDKRHGSENDPVDAFGDDQLFVIFVVANGGADLEHFEVHSFEEARSIILQVRAGFLPSLHQWQYYRFLSYSAVQTFYMLWLGAGRALTSQVVARHLQDCRVWCQSSLVDLDWYYLNSRPSDAEETLAISKR